MTLALVILHSLIITVAVLLGVGVIFAGVVIHRYRRYCQEGGEEQASRLFDHGVSR